MNVLIACEESQVVCKAFRKKGHAAYSCDILECSGGHPEWHIFGDVLPILNGNCEFLLQSGEKKKQKDKWDLIIAHPPCTYLSNVGARHLYSGGCLNEDRLRKGIAASHFFMAFYFANCDKVVIENPVPSSVYMLPKYSQIIQPYQFGHPFTKKTCLWIKGLEYLKPTKNVGKPETVYMIRRDGTLRANCWEMMKKGGKERAIERSKTFSGIAEAMANQWG